MSVTVKAASVAVLIHDAKKLDTKISSLRTRSASLHLDMHSVAVSVLFHAAQNGRVKALNDFYGLLSEAYKSAFRQYVGRHCGDFKEENDVKVWSGFLKFHKGEFALTEAKDSKAAFIAKSDKLLVSKRFFDRDPQKGIDVFLTIDTVMPKADAILKQAKAAVDNGKMDGDTYAIIVDFQKKLSERKSEVDKQRDNLNKAKVA